MGFDDTGLGAAMAQSHSDSRIRELEKTVALLLAKDREVRHYIVQLKTDVQMLKDGNPA